MAPHFTGLMTVTSLMKLNLLTEAKLTKPLYAWGIKDNYILSAKSGLKVAEVEVLQKKNELIREVINLYLNYQLAHKMVNLAERNLEKLNKIEAYTHKENENSKKLLEKNEFVLNENRKDLENDYNIIFELQNF